MEAWLYPKRAEGRDEPWLQGWGSKLRCRRAVSYSPAVTPLNTTRHIVFIFQMMCDPSYSSKVISTFQRLTIMTLLKYKRHNTYAAPLAPEVCKFQQWDNFKLTAHEMLTNVNSSLPRHLAMTPFKVWEKLVSYIQNIWLKMTALRTSSYLHTARYILHTENYSIVKVPYNPDTALQYQRDNCTRYTTDAFKWGKIVASAKADPQHKWNTCKGFLSARLYTSYSQECLFAISSKNTTDPCTKKYIKKNISFLIWYSASVLKHQRHLPVVADLYHKQVTVYCQTHLYCDPVKSELTG